MTKASFKKTDDVTELGGFEDPNYLLLLLASCNY